MESNVQCNNTRSLVLGTNTTILGVRKLHAELRDTELKDVV